MNNVLVTGATGFIGRQLIKELIRNNIQVTAVVRSQKKSLKLFQEINNLNLVCCEMSKIYKLEEYVKNMPGYDTLYHLAWEGTSGDMRADYSCQCNNVKYTLDLINVAYKLGVKRFIGAGTLAEYDNLAYLPLDGANPNAVAMYAAAKISVHYMSKIECNRLGMEHVWGIFSNIYGVGNTTNNFVNFASRLMLAGKRASFTLGEQNYDFVYISDFIKGLFLLGEKGKNNCEYFVGSGAPRKLKEYIYDIRNAIDSKIEVHLGEIPYHGVSLDIEKLSTEKLERDTGYQAEIDFGTGIHKTISWLRQQNN